MADLKPRIERLVGRLVGGWGGGTERPAGGPPPELRPGDAGFAEAVARLVAMPLDQFASGGAPIEIRVPWCRETLWFVPDERAAEVLGRDGVGRGRAWTARELSQPMALAERRHAARILALAKRAVDGDIAEIRGQGPRAGRGPR